MQHRVDPAGNVQILGDIAAEEVETPVVEQMRDIGRRPREVVVDAENVRAVGEQPLTDVAAEKARPTRDDDPHRCPLPCCSAEDEQYGAEQRTSDESGRGARRESSSSGWNGSDREIPPPGNPCLHPDVEQTIVKLLLQRVREGCSDLCNFCGAKFVIR